MSRSELVCWVLIFFFFFGGKNHHTCSLIVPIVGKSLLRSIHVNCVQGLTTPRVAEHAIFNSRPGTMFTSGSIANQFHEWDLNSYVYTHLLIHFSSRISGILCFRTLQKLSRFDMSSLWDITGVVVSQRQCYLCYSLWNIRLTSRFKHGFNPFVKFI